MLEHYNVEQIVEGINGFDGYYAYPYSGDNTYYLQYDKSVITNVEDNTNGILTFTLTLSCWC